MSSSGGGGACGGNTHTHTRACALASGGDGYDHCPRRERNSFLSCRASHCTFRVFVSMGCLPSTSTSRSTTVDMLAPCWSAASRKEMMSVFFVLFWVSECQSECQIVMYGMKPKRRTGGEWTV